MYGEGLSNLRTLASPGETPMPLQLIANLPDVDYMRSHSLQASDSLYLKKNTQHKSQCLATSQSLREIL